MPAPHCAEHNHTNAIRNCFETSPSYNGENVNALTSSARTFRVCDSVGHDWTSEYSNTSTPCKRARQACGRSLLLGAAPSLSSPSESDSSSITVLGVASMSSMLRDFTREPDAVCLSSTQPTQRSPSTSQDCASCSDDRPNHSHLCLFHTMNQHTVTPHPVQSV